MFKLIKIYIILFSLLLPCISIADKNNVIIPKIGAYKLKYPAQNSSRVFDTASSNEYAIEYEWRLSHGMTIGGEFISFSNTYTQIGQSHNVDTEVYFFNFKKYFNVTERFKPFIGVGGGYARVETTETIFNEFSGLATQLLFGLAYNFEWIGLYAEYKFLESKTESDSEFFVRDNIKISGDGIFIGVSAIF